MERLAREALTLHFKMSGALTSDAVDTAMGLYSKAFGPGAALAFINRVNRELSEDAWSKVSSV